MTAPAALRPRSLTWRTDLDVLPADATVERCDDHLVIRTPSAPEAYWANFLLFDEAPRSGGRERWEAAWLDAFGDRLEHRAFGWDQPDAPVRVARTELAAAGYEVETTVALTVPADGVYAHPRINHDIDVVLLDPAFGGEHDELWAGIDRVQQDVREYGFAASGHRRFVEQRMQDMRERLAAGAPGAWVAATDPDDGSVASACGFLATGEQVRYQAIDTALKWRCKGAARRVVLEAAHVARERFGATELVVASDLDYHALPTYESLGFEERERVASACWWPGAPRASAHPALGA